MISIVLMMQSPRTTWEVKHHFGYGKVSTTYTVQKCLAKSA